MTLVELLRRAARGPHGVRFLDRHENATYVLYRDIEEKVAATATAIQALGVERGDNVALILPTGLDFYAAFFATLWLGAVPVPLYPPVRLGRLDEYHTRTAEMLRQIDAALVLTDERVRRILGQAVAASAPRLGCVSMQSLVMHGSMAPVSLDPNDTALIQFSSGTTVEPKPVELSHAHIVANITAIHEAIVSQFPEAPGAPHSAVSWLPLYHDMGLIGALLTSVAHGTDLTLLGPEAFVTRPALWLRAIARYGATVSPAPNFAYSLCAERIRDEELEGVDLSCWRVALNGAEAVTVTALEKFNARFAPFGLRPDALTPVYGLAEAALAVTFSPPHQPFRVQHFDPAALESYGVAVPVAQGRALVSVGRPLTGYAIRIVGGGGTPLSAGICGRVQVRGPSIMRGYYNNPTATSRTLSNGWLDTGDTGFIHEDELFLFGRAKDLIILRGRNYAPQDIEQALDSVPGVRLGCSVAASFLPLGADTEALIVFVEHRGGPRDDEAAFTLAIRQRVIEVTGLVPERIVILKPGTLPRTSSGKLRRRAALERYLQGTLLPPRRASALHLAAAMVRSSWAMGRADWRRAR